MNKRRQAMVCAALLCGAAGATPAGVLVIQRPDEVVTLDPAQAYDGVSNSVIENLYETLLTYDGKRTDKFKPLLATSYSVADGGRTYVFTLRRGVRFHSGNPMTCADAAYSFRRLLTVNNSTSGGVFMSLALLGFGEWTDATKRDGFAKIARAVSCDAKNRLVFRLPKPDPAFLAKLLFTGSSIVDQKDAAAGGEWSGAAKDWNSWVGRDVTQSRLNDAPSGTGAYRVLSKDGERMVFQAFDGYWGGTPKLKTVIRQKVENDTARSLALRNGDADLVDVGRASLATLRGVAGVRIVDDLPSLGVQAIFFNQKINGKKYLGSGALGGGIPADFFADVHVRRAFAAAFDPQRYVREVLQGKGRWLTMALPESFGGYDAKVPRVPFDRTRAVAEFKQARSGAVWQQGFTLNAIYFVDDRFKGALDILKTNIESLNPRFKIILTPVQDSQWSAEAGTGQAPLAFATWAPPDFPDSDNYIRNFYASGGYFASRTNARDARLDALIEQAYATPVPEKRAALYSSVARRAAETVPLVNVPLPVNFAVLRADVKGFEEGYNPMLFGGVLWRQLAK